MSNVVKDFILFKTEIYSHEIGAAGIIYS